jgi:hypothetical protein
MGNAGEIAEEEKEISEEGAIWARKLDGAAVIATRYHIIIATGYRIRASSHHHHH